MNRLLVIQQLVTAMKKAKDVGCVDHLDCCDDVGAFWYDALEAGEKALSNKHPDRTLCCGCGAILSSPTKACKCLAPNNPQPDVVKIKESDFKTVQVVTSDSAYLPPLGVEIHENKWPIPPGTKLGKRPSKT